MNAVVHPGRLRGAVDAIPSKSCAHRALICAALAGEPTIIEMGARSRDIEVTAACLRALGADIREGPGALRVAPLWGRVSAAPELNCGESGSTLRFLLPVAAALGASARFVGQGRLPERPNAALTGQLREHGAAVEGDCLPIRVGGVPKSGRYRLPGDVSSQFASGLLFMLPLLEGDSEIRFTSPVESAGYIDLTIAELSRFGVRTEKLPDGYRVPGGQRYASPGRVRVEGDWSNAAFYLAANALGGCVDVQGLDAESAQADRAIADLLPTFSSARDRVIDASGIPDLAPILAVLAAYAPDVTRIERAARLRMKESDRLSAMAECLTRLGARVEEQPDGLIIQGGEGLRGGAVRGHNDHRVVMAMAIAATAAEGPVTIEGVEAVQKSYPGFFDDFKKLGGIAHVQ